MQHDVYDYTQLASNGTVQKNVVLRKTYALLGLSFIPCAFGAFIGEKINFNLDAMLGNRMIGFVVLLAFFYGMCFLIEKNRYSNVGTTLLMIFTFGMGLLLSPILQYSLSLSNGPKIVGIVAAMTAGAFFTAAAMARRTNMNMNSLSRFLIVGAVVLMIGVIANFFLNMPALSLTISSGFVIFSSLMIMWQVRTIIDGGEDSYISAALTIFISIYNIFVSLLNIVTALSGRD